MALEESTLTKPSSKPRTRKLSTKKDAKETANPVAGPDPALVEQAENKAKEYLQLGLEAEKKRNWEAAIECYRVVLRINPVDPVTRYLAPYNTAHSLYRLKRFEEAAGYAHAAVAADRERHPAYNLLGIIYIERGMYQDAAWYLLAAARRATKSKAAWLNLQVILSKHPELLTDVPYLADTVDATRKLLESRGVQRRTH